MSIWYRTGTAAVTNGSTAVVGTLTAWLTYVRPGDAITFDGGASWHEVAAIASNTSLTLAVAYGGSTASGIAYAINPSSYRHQIPSDILERLREVLDGQTDVFLTTGAPLDVLGSEGAIAFDPAAKVLYVKGASAWGTAVAFGTPGPPGNEGDPGTNGTNGWSPQLAIITDGARRVLQVTGWAGGSGSAPATGSYIGVTGLVADIADAIDIRGPAGVGSSTNWGDIGGTLASQTDLLAALGAKLDPSGAVAFSGVISPTSLTADVNDYAPTSLAGASVLRLSSDALRHINGLTGGAAGRILVLHNVGSFGVNLKDEAGSSTAANRFALTADVLIAPDAAVLIQYDATSQRWRVIGGTGGGVAGREVLTVNRTYYVRTDGNDSNSGLANTSGGAFLTIQKAIDTAASLDTAVYDVTVSVNAGTYTGACVLKQLVGAGKLILQGDTTTPANVLISTSASCISSSTTNGGFEIKGFKLVSSAGSALDITGGPGLRVSIANLDFGACAAGYHIFLINGAVMQVDGPITISGSAVVHMLAANLSFLRSLSVTYTITGTPAFAGFFVQAGNLGGANYTGSSFSGSATGVRYSVNLNSVLNTGGGGASFFPGNSAGSAATGGQYA